MPPTTDPTKTPISLRRTPDFDALIQAFDGFISICSQDYRIQYMNDKLCERTGYDATGEYCYKILHGCDDVCPWCNNEEFFREHKTLRRQLKSPKDERWYDIINTPIHNADGSISKQSLIMDITESYLAKEDLSLLQTLINQSNDAIFVIDADTSAFIFVNGKACANLGYTTEELLSLQVSDISMHSRDMPSWHNHVDCLRKQSLLFEAEQVRKDGTRIFVEVNASFVSLNDKNFVVSIVRDISDRKAQTRSLFEEKNKLESLLATLADGITVQDTDFKILYQNKVHSDKQGIHTGEYCYQAYQNRTTICPGCLLAQSFIDGKVHRRETTASTEKGIIHLEVTSSPMKDADGNIIAGIESVRDITVQKKLEERLRQSQKMEAMGTLAGGIAHDLNNILTPVLGYSGLALTKLASNEPLFADLQQITKAAGRAKDLVQQILTFSRQAHQERKAFEPHLVVNEAIKLIRASLPSTIKIYKDISSECGAIMADPTQLHQIIMNLCTNAYHAMRETGGVLGVSLAKITIEKDSEGVSPELARGNYVVIEVSDTGCGMDDKTLARVFEPYFTTKTKGEGTGLGLSVVHGIVESYQGQIVVHSEPGKGASFRVYLPSIAETPSFAEAVCSETIPTGTERVLLVDDDETISTMLQHVLRSLGYQVTSYNNSLDALACLAREPMAFDLLITDMTMPNLTGYQLAQKVLAIRSNLPIILCTGFSELINKEQAQALGIRAYLAKPIAIQELGMTVRKVLDA